MTQVQQQSLNGGQHTFPNASWGGQQNFRQLDGEAAMEEEEEDGEPSADAEGSDCPSDTSFQTLASAAKAPSSSNSTYAR